jgi:hypothetical protein
MRTPVRSGFRGTLLAWRKGLRPSTSRSAVLTRRPRPSGGERPTVRFVIAVALTIAYVALGIVVSAPWRSDLREAIGPVMAWAIPILLAYLPGLLIGFLAFTLMTLRYRVPSPDPPRGPWPDGQWPSVTVIVAAWNEERGIASTLDRIAGLAYAGPFIETTVQPAAVARSSTCSAPADWDVVFGAP